MCDLLLVKSEYECIFVDAVEVHLVPFVIEPAHGEAVDLIDRFRVLHGDGVVRVLLERLYAPARNVQWHDCKYGGALRVVHVVHGVYAVRPPEFVYVEIYVLATRLEVCDV